MASIKVVFLLLVVATTTPTIITIGPSSEPPTAIPTKIPTEPPTESSTEPPSEPPIEPSTEPSSKSPTERPTEPPSKPPTEPPSKPVTEQPTEPPSKPPTQQPTEPPSKPPTEHPTEPPSKPPTEQPTDPPSKPPTGRPTEPPTEPPSDPTTEPTTYPPSTSTTIVTSTPARLTCPPYWIDGKTASLGCLHFNLKANMNWTQASEYCCSLHKGSHLIEIFNEEQQNFVKGEVEMLQNIDGIPRNWWIASTDINREGNWYWPRSLKDTTYHPWVGTADSSIWLNYAYLDSSAHYYWAVASEDSNNNLKKIFVICQKYLNAGLTNQTDSPTDSSHFF